MPRIFWKGLKMDKIKELDKAQRKLATLRKQILHTNLPGRLDMADNVLYVEDFLRDIATDLIEMPPEL